jgi:hypothetical protein
VLTRRLLPLIAALAIGVGGYVHFQIWRLEYRHVPVREMFIANWIASAIVVAALVVIVAASRTDHRIGQVTLLAGMLLSAGSLAAFALSHGPGLPTLHGTFKETGLETTGSHLFNLGSAKTVLVAETIALLACGVSLVRRPTT